VLSSAQTVLRSENGLTLANYATVISKVLCVRTQRDASRGRCGLTCVGWKDRGWRACAAERSLEDPAKNQDVAVERAGNSSTMVARRSPLLGKRDCGTCLEGRIGLQSSPERGRSAHQGTDLEGKWEIRSSQNLHSASYDA
jgi:hypothetical protein